MEQKDVLNALLKLVPDLESEVLEGIRSVGNDQDMHVILGDAINPYLTNLLEKNYVMGSRENEELRKLFYFLEELAKSDAYLQNVLQITIFEYLIGKEEWMKNSVEYIHPLSKKLLKEIYESTYNKPLLI